MSNEAKTPCYSVSITRSDSIRRSYHTRRPIGTLRHRSHRSNQTVHTDRPEIPVLDEVKFDLIRSVRSHQGHPVQTRTDTIKIIHQTINRIEQSTSQEIEDISTDIQGAACYLTSVTAVVMEQEKTVEQEKQRHLRSIQ